MERFRAGSRGQDSAHTALVVGALAVVVGGAALFGLVAHVWTPYLPQQGAGASPLDPISRSQVAAYSKMISEFTGQRSKAVTGEPPRPVPLLVETRSMDTATFRLALESLSDDESLVFGPPVEHESKPFDLNAPEIKPVDIEPVEINIDTKPLETMLAGQVLAPLARVKVTEPFRIETKVVELARIEPKGLVKVAEVKVLPPKPAPEPKVVVARKPEPKRIEPKIAVRIEPKPAPVKVVEAKPVQPAKPVAPKVTKVAESKPVQPAKPVAVKVVEAKPAPPPKPALTKLAEAKAPMRQVSLKLASTKPAGRPVETKLADAKAAEAKRAAEMRANEVKLAETKRAAERLAAETKLANEMRIAEAKLAETKLLAEMRATEAKLEEAQRAAEARAAEAKLAETKRQVERTLAEAKLAEEKLTETKRAAAVGVAESKLSQLRRAVETRFGDSRRSQPQYARCEDCGKVTSIIARSQDRGSRDWEVRVNFGDTYRIFVFPSDPGFAIGDSVRVYGGRLTRM